MVDAIQGLPPLRKLDSYSPEAQKQRNESENKGDLYRLAVETEDKSSGKSGKVQDTDLQLSKAGFDNLANKLKPYLEEQNLAIEFAKDDATNKMIMKIVDSETHEVVKQLPPEVTLKIARIVSSQLEAGQVTNARV